MKKLLTLFLALVMVLTCVATLASCNDKDAEDGDAVKVVDIKLTEEQYAFAVAKGNTTLLAQLNDFMDEIMEDGTFDEIINNYFGDGEPQRVTSAATKKTDGSQLIVATNAAFEPFEYKSGDYYYGVDMEIMAAFAEYLDKELYIDNMEFDAVCLAVSTEGGSYEGEDGESVQVTGGVCDVAAAGLTVNSDREQILDFSKTYYEASQMIIAAADDDTFADCETAADVEEILKEFGSDVKVGVQNGTTGAFYCRGDADWGFEGFDFTTVGYNNGALAVQDLINGNCKYVVIDEGPAKAIVERMNAVN